LAIVVLSGACVSPEVMPVPGGPGLEPPGGMEGMDEIGEDPVTRLVPVVCDTRSWSTVTPDDKDLDLAVVGTRTGASIFSVAKAGGALRGFQVDGRGEVIGDRAGTTLRADAQYTAVSATLAAERLVVAAVADDKVTLDLVSDNLAAHHELGRFDGTFVGDMPVLPTRDARVAIVGGALGVTATSFAGLFWNQSPTETLTKDAVVSMTATAYRDDAMIAWSTDARQCHLQRFSSRQESVRNFGCEGARIAADARTNTGTLVYEDQGNVMRTDIRVGGESELANRVQLAELASSPRVAFDGQRTWISYLNVHGDLVVGFVDEHGTLISRALEGTRPQPDAYELAFFADAMWVVSVGELGFGGQRMCVVAQ